MWDIVHETMLAQCLPLSEVSVIMECSTNGENNVHQAAHDENNGNTVFVVGKKKC